MVNITLDEFIERMCRPDFREELRDQGEDLIVDTSWDYVVAHVSQPKPKMVIGHMVRLAVQTGVKIRTTDGDRPPILPYENAGVGLHSLAALSKVLVLEQMGVHTPGNFQQGRTNLTRHVTERMAQYPFFGILYLPEQGINTLEFERQLSTASREHNFILEINGNRDEGLQNGLKLLWRRLMRSLDW